MTSSGGGIMQRRKGGGTFWSCKTPQTEFFGVSGCRDLKCKNCLWQGHLAKDCKNPRRCKSCGGEGHLAHSCPRQEATYAMVLAGAGGGSVAPQTVGRRD
uniref:CCHC-type domain-containing protein n=1 Tax=Pygocentrus nattereri TaxID=42514 RepID=A0A3B4E239_PYGNA